MSINNARNQVYLTKAEWETLISSGSVTLASGTTVTYSPNDTYYIPEETATTYEAEKGISLSGTKFGHSNTAITAQTTQAVYPIEIDAYGHITSYGTAVSIPVVNNPTISFTQGGVAKGSFTLNQSGNATIALDAGGGGSVSLYAHNLNFNYSTGTFTAQIITDSSTAFTAVTLNTWLVGKGFTSADNSHTASGVATSSGAYKGIIVGLIGISGASYAQYVYSTDTSSRSAGGFNLLYGLTDSVTQII